MTKAVAAVGAAMMIVAVAASVGQTPAADAHTPAKDQVEAGAALFHQSGCEHCHGVDGRGTDLAPDLSTVGRRLKKAQIERQIREGGKSMPAFGDALQPDQIQELVAFLHTRKGRH